MIKQRDIYCIILYTYANNIKQYFSYLRRNGPNKVGCCPDLFLINPGLAPFASSPLITVFAVFPICNNFAVYIRRVIN